MITRSCISFPNVIGWWCGCTHFCLRLHNCRNLQLSRPVLHISLTEVVDRVPPTWLGHFVKPHLLLPNALHAVLYHLGDFAHYLDRFVIFAQLAMLYIFFIIILLIPIILIVGSCKMAQTVCDSIQYLLKSYFSLCGCRSCLFNISHIFLLLHHRCLCVLNSLSCHCGLSIHIILDSCLFCSLFKMYVFRLFSVGSFFLDRKLRNAPNAPTISASKQLLHLLCWCCSHVHWFVELPYLPAGSGKSFFFGALTILSCVDLVVGREVECSKIWTTWRQGASYMSRLVDLINLNKAKSVFWPSLHWEKSC